MSTSSAGGGAPRGEATRTSGLFRLLLVVTSLLGVLSAASAVTASAPRPEEAVIIPPARTPLVTTTSGPFAPPAIATGARPETGPSAGESSPAVSERGEQNPIDPSCRLGEAHSPRGSTSVIPTDYAAPDASRVLRFRIEIEDGLAIDGECFSDAVAAILNDPRGWGEDGLLAFQPVTDADPDFRVILASPATTDGLCYPLRTGGKYSCRSGAGVVLNLNRWESGTQEYEDNLDIYRQYLVSHEVGHFLGHGHRQCPGPGEPAPVMMQQTKGLRECLLNGWPTSDER